MKHFNVTLRKVCVFRDKEVIVEADNKEDAKAKAMEKATDVKWEEIESHYDSMFPTLISEEK